MTTPPIGLGPSTSRYSAVNERPEWPTPEVIGEPDPHGMGKAAVLDLARLAEAHGWTVRITKARGSWPSTGGRPSQPYWSLAVRMFRINQRAVAVYVETGRAWSWKTLYRWNIGEFPTMDAAIGGFTDAVFGPLCKPAWPGPQDWTCPYFGPVHGPERPPKR